MRGGPHTNWRTVSRWTLCARRSVRQLRGRRRRCPRSDERSHGRISPVRGVVDAIVIGGSVGGLVASLYLRRAGRSVLLLEAREMLGGACPPVPSAGAATLFAIDPRMIDELDLLNRG